MFFTIDGADGAGKTTQADRLCQRLETAGFSVCRARDPGSTALGNAVRDILLHRHEMSISPLCELFLFMAARSQMIKEIIKPALAEKKIVVCDRFQLSSVVYQGIAGGVGVSDVETLGKIATDGISPTISFVLDISQSAAQQRMQIRSSADRMEQKNADFQTRVREGFREMARQKPKQYVLIDGSQSLETVESEIWENVYRIVSRAGVFYG